jgi:antitoxin component of MazEF toxin-antitoxin module
MEEKVTALTVPDGPLGVPAEALKEAGLRPGDEVVLESGDDEVRIRRRTASEQIDAQIAAGEVEFFDSDEAFEAALRARLKPLAEE